MMSYINMCIVIFLVLIECSCFPKSAEEADELYRNIYGLDKPGLQDDEDDNGFKQPFEPLTNQPIPNIPDNTLYLTIQKADGAHYLYTYSSGIQSFDGVDGGVLQNKYSMPGIVQEAILFGTQFQHLRKESHSIIGYPPNATKLQVAVNDTTYPGFRLSFAKNPFNGQDTILIYFAGDQPGTYYCKYIQATFTFIGDDGNYVSYKKGISNCNDDFSFTVYKVGTVGEQIIGSFQMALQKPNANMENDRSILVKGEYNVYRQEDNENIWYFYY